MIKKWKDKTCEKCIFRDDFCCRRMPPEMFSNGQTGHPRVAWNRWNNGIMATAYSNACACYKEEK